MTNTKTWLEEALQFYRQFDFFAAQKSLSTEGLAQQIMDSEGSRIESALNADESDLWLTGEEEMDAWLRLSNKLMPDLVLLSLDKERVWWEDGECDIYEEGHIYERVLMEWSGISRGAWKIENVREHWVDKHLDGVFFEWKQEKYKVHPQWDGWIDFDLLQPINELILESHYVFRSAPIGDQTTYLLVLSDAECSVWEKERGWQF